METNLCVVLFEINEENLKTRKKNMFEINDDELTVKLCKMSYEKYLNNLYFTQLILSS